MRVPNTTIFLLLYSYRKPPFLVLYIIFILTYLFLYKKYEQTLYTVFAESGVAALKLNLIKYL